METPKIDFFDRDDKGKLLPVKVTINDRNKLILEQIEVYKEKKEKEEKKQFPEKGKEAEKSYKNQQVYKKVIEMLKEEYKKSGEDIEIEFIPIMDYEFTNLRPNNTDCNGKEVDDQQASIIGSKLVKPKITYEEAKVMKSKRLKVAIVEAMYKECMPQLEENKERLKKVVAQLKDLEE